MSPFAFELIETLPESFLSPKGETNKKLLRLATEEVEELRILLEDMRRLRTADNCEGKLLDNLGDLIQAKRGGRSDEAYREHLRLAPAVNRSAGSVPELIEIARSVAGEHFVSLREIYPGNSGLWEENELWLDGGRYLSGDWFLSGEDLGEAMILVRVSGDTPDDIIEDLNNALSLAKAAGTAFRIVRIT